MKEMQIKTKRYHFTYQTGKGWGGGTPALLVAIQHIPCSFLGKLLMAQHQNCTDLLIQQCHF
jgi:hypothetical protein